jgi:hypothetical protein
MAYGRTIPEHIKELTCLMVNFGCDICKIMKLSLVRSMSELTGFDADGDKAA